LNQPQRILLTGATGFIGQHVHRALLDQGHRVIALIRPERKEVALDPRTSIRRCNLLDREAMLTAVCDVDAVISLAGAVRGRNPDAFRTANIDACAVLRDAMTAVAPNIPLLHLSSLAASQPQISDYAASKRAGEDCITSSSLNWCVFRPPAVYGPGERELRPLLDWMGRGVVLIPGNAAQRLAFIHVADLTAACVAWLAQSTLLSRRIFEIDDGEPMGYDWSAIAAACAARRHLRWVVPAAVLQLLSRVSVWVSSIRGIAPMLSPGKVRELMFPSWVGSGAREGNNAFTAATGWQPEWKLAAGVRQTLASR
jgi:nucleoside-diphosphate-sugar epimerase